MPVILLLTSCDKKTKDLEKDVTAIGDVMCRIMETMNTLKITNPEDGLAVMALQKKSEDLQAELAVHYKNFQVKYGKKMTDPEFKKEYNKEIKKVMLNCKYLSNEDKERYMKEVE